MKNLKEEALRYHSSAPKGKLGVVPTKPYMTQHDLSMAYTPGVAVPCMEIYDDPEKVYEYTGKGNLVRLFRMALPYWGWAISGPRLRSR